MPEVPQPPESEGDSRPGTRCSAHDGRRGSECSGTLERPPTRGWIDVHLCEEIVSKPIKLVLGVDGSDTSMVALTYLTERIMQRDRETFCEVVHAYDDKKEYLPPAWRRENLRTTCDSTLTSALSSKRYRMRWLPKGARTAAAHLCDAARDSRADYALVGFSGRKGRRDRKLLCSNVAEVLKNASCTVIVIKDEDRALLPLGLKPTKFVVSVGLHQAATRGFLDALRLSRPGDEIHVVYVMAYMENSESEYTKELREKYAAFFSALQDGEQEVFSKFSDREVDFHMIKKQRRETTCDAIVRYAEEIEADFLCVGTNEMKTGGKEKSTGGLALQICMETDRNFIVSSWIDIEPEVYEKHVRKSIWQK